LYNKSTTSRNVYNKSKAVQHLYTTAWRTCIRTKWTSRPRVSMLDRKCIEAYPNWLGPTSLGEIVSGTRNSRNIGLRIHGLNMNAAVEVSVSYNVPGLSIGILIMVYYYHVKNVSIVIYLWSWHTYLIRVIITILKTKTGVMLHIAHQTEI